MQIDKKYIEKRLAKVSRKLKNKSVIIYAAGSYFQAINEAFDLKSMFNIIGISDSKFDSSQEGANLFGYKTISRCNIFKYQPDYVLISAKDYQGIIDDFISVSPKKNKTKFIPITGISIRELIIDLFR